VNAVDCNRSIPHKCSTCSLDGSATKDAPVPAAFWVLMLAHVFGCSSRSGSYYAGPVLSAAMAPAMSSKLFGVSAGAAARREREDARRGGHPVQPARGRLAVDQFAVLQVDYEPHQFCPNRRGEGFAEVSDVFLRGDTTCPSYRSSLSIRRVRLLGVEIAMRRYRSCAPPSTNFSARDNRGGAFLRRVFW
jgi:hypothetical protein